MLAPYPMYEKNKINTVAEADMTWLQNLITAVRNIRGEMGLGNARLLPVLLQHLTPAESEQIERIKPLFLALAKVESVTLLTATSTPPLSSSSVIGHVNLFVPMKGLIDPKVELARLQKEASKLTANNQQIENKLNNQGFISKAPAEVVKAEQEKLAEQNAQLAVITAQIKQIEQL